MEPQTMPIVHSAMLHMLEGTRCPVDQELGHGATSVMGIDLHVMSTVVSMRYRKTMRTLLATKAKPPIPNSTEMMVFCRLGSCIL